MILLRHEQATRLAFDLAECMARHEALFPVFVEPHRVSGLAGETPVIETLRRQKAAAERMLKLEAKADEAGEETSHEHDSVLHLLLKSHGHRTPPLKTLNPLDA
eukprot:GABV01011919.1.p2 GENE.GABV01011919.1~~GABV01011919.1.p2  ORF type:complete len:104 (-),score=27.68 GABV01011919.1:3-314(-)